MYWLWKTNTSISNMIDECESVFLLNTPQSISLEDNINKEQTSSPWIYNELSIANIIRVRRIEDYRRQYTFLEHKDGVFANESAGLTIKYNVDDALQDFLLLTVDELKTCARSWKNDRRFFQNALDYIYLSKGIISKQVLAD